MEQDKDKQFIIPKNEDDLEGATPPPSEKAVEINKKEGSPGTNEETTPKVDNFTPPQGEKASAGSLAMPSDKETKTFESPAKESLENETPSTETEEVEDVFAPKEETPPPPSPAKPEPVPEPGTPTPPPPIEPVSSDGGQGGQKLDISENKGYGWLWLIAVFLVLILLSETIAVNELGIFNLGIEKYYGVIHLEKLWGGLPADGRAALADSVKKMASKSFNFDGSSQASLSVTPALTLNKVKGVETNGALAKDIISRIKNEGLDVQNKINIQANVISPNKFKIILSTNSEQLTGPVTDLLDGEATIDLTAINDGQDIYLNNAGLKKILDLNQNWLKVIIPENTSSSTSQEVKVAEIISSGERIGSVRIKGVSCYIYEVKINSSALSNYLKNANPNFAWLADDVSFQSVKFYLGKRDHLPHQLEITMNHNPGNYTLKNKTLLNFENWGGNISLDLPPADAVVEKNWSTVKDAFISPAPTPTPTGTAEERDKQRKSDLKKIQDALLAYKVQNGKYPSTSSAIEKTKDVTSNLKNALVPKYLDSLPVDPINDKYYYGYKSDDGSKCEITSILENLTDPDGENFNGTVLIYRLSGN